MLNSTRENLAQRIFHTANIKGQFRLRSGVLSDEYFDKYLFEANPELLRDIAQAMVALLPDSIDGLAGLEMGGIPLATVLSQITNIPVLFVRKKAKDYGTCKLAEGGPVAGRKLVIVEDVITSGGQIRESVRALRDLGANIQYVVGVIDREAGGAENLHQDDLELRALFTSSELRSASV